MPFQPGQSGNPGGRPKAVTALAEKAREHGDTALQVHIDALTDPDVKVRMVAANYILDRGYGKPAQPIGGSDDLPSIGIEQIVRRIVDPRNTDA